jgi:hypothetical protein
LLRKGHPPEAVFLRHEGFEKVGGRRSEINAGCALRRSAHEAPGRERLFLKARKPVTAGGAVLFMCALITGGYTLLSRAVMRPYHRIDIRSHHRQ